MFARTDRLLLRPGWADDAPALTAAIGNEAIVLNLSKVPWPYDVQDAEAYLGRDRADNEADFLIFLRTEGAPRLIGGIGLAQGEMGVEFGYWIVPSCWGLGFATEAGRAVIDLARDSLRIDQIMATPFADNPASRHVLKKLGFQRTGSTVRHSIARGGESTCDIMTVSLNPTLALAA